MYLFIYSSLHVSSMSCSSSGEQIVSIQLLVIVTPCWSISPFNICFAVFLCLSFIFTFLVNKTNRRTEFQFYCYYDSTCFGQPFCPSSGVLSRTSALVHYCRFDDRLLPGAGWNCSSILLLVANGSSQLNSMYLSRCTAKNSWWWAGRLPLTCTVVILRNLEFSASVGFYSQGICYDAQSYDRKSLLVWLLAATFRIVKKVTKNIFFY